MTFIKPTLNDGNPGPAVYTAIEAIMLADGWTLEDTVVISTNTFKVLKSAGSGNARGLDWYLAIMYPTTGIGSGMKFVPYEGYNSTTHLITRGPMWGGTGITLESTYYSRYGNTTSTLDNTNHTGSTTGTLTYMPLSSSSFTYYVSVTRNRLWAFSTAGPQATQYAGFFIPTTAHMTLAGSALFPLVHAKIDPTGNCFSNSTLGSTNMNLTRMPKFTTGTDLQNSCRGFAPPVLSSGTIGVGNGLAVGETVIVPIAITMGTNQTTVFGGNFVGYFDGLAAGAVIGSAVRGDTVTIGTDTWYMLTPSTGSTLFMQAI